MTHALFATARLGTPARSIGASFGLDWIELLGPEHERLNERREVGVRGFADVGFVDRHLAPTGDLEAFRFAPVDDRLLAGRTRRVVVAVEKREHDPEPVGVELRPDGLGTDAREEPLGNRDEDAGAVARQPIGRDRTPVLDAGETGEGEVDDGAGGLSGFRRDEADSAGIEFGLSPVGSCDHSVLARGKDLLALGDGAVARPMIATGLVNSPSGSAGSSPLVAVLGAGQLGRMLGEAGRQLGIEFRFLDPSPDATARAFGPLVVGELGDQARIEEVARGATVVTYEWEGVPADGARSAAALAPVRPDPRALDVAQDRLTEKTTFRELGIGVPQFSAVDERADLDRAVDEIGLPAVLKTRRGGYDGKGQHVLRSETDVDAGWDSLGGVPLILEQLIPFERELSVLAVRGLDGDTRCYPLVENVHRGGILRVSRAPAPALTPDLQTAGESIATKLLDRLGYVGVLAVELFDHGGELLANEIAPRVHNSGHWTIEGAETSQFENHLRAVLGWPLGSTEVTGHSVMVNCIGSMPDPERVAAIDAAALHDYEKEPRAGRKLGHITSVAATSEERDVLADQLKAVVEG